MLTSITPLGERGRGQRWSTTSVWLMIGHLAGGLALGLVLAGIGLMTRRVIGAADDTAATLIIGAVAISAAVFDVSGRQLPGRRQVDERWLTTYRGWVYGGGFGLQLGFGLVTVVNTSLVLAVLMAGVLQPAANALVLGVVYGGTRGVVATATGWMRSVSDVHRLHRWLDRSERSARWLAAGLGTVSAIAAMAMT
jgi:hypothetical protein